MRNKDIRVAMVIDQFHPLIGGAENQALELSRELVKGGCYVQVVTSRPQGRSKMEMIDGITVHRIRIFNLPYLQKALFMGSIAFRLFLLRKTYDVIHAHIGRHNAFISAVVGRILGKHVLVKISNSGERFDLLFLKNHSGVFGRHMSDYLVRNVDCFISLTPEIRKELIRAGVDEARIANIPNGVKDVSNVLSKEEIRKRLGILHEDKIGMCVASFQPKKNHETLLEAVKAVDNKEFFFLLVGDGPLRNNILGKIEDYKLENRVKLTGWRNDVSDYLACADFFILLSWTEGFSNALLEAMVQGLPCIASDIPGNRALIDDGKDGILVNPKDPVAIGKVISAMFDGEHKPLEIGKRARKKVLDNYHISKIGERYCELYYDLLGRGNAVGAVGR